MHPLIFLLVFSSENCYDLLWKKYSIDRKKLLKNGGSDQKEQLLKYIAEMPLGFQIWVG